MFTKSVLSASLFALAMGKPIARRDHPGSPLNIVPLVVHEGAAFDPSSSTISQFNVGQSFDGFGGLGSLIGFDSFYGSSNFCGVQNVLIKKEVVTCTVTPVTVIQQHLAVVAEFAKKVILTQSCETEAQVVLFSQWLGNLVSFGQDLRRTNGRSPTYDSNIASQIPQLVDVSGQVNTAGFAWSGSSIGSHAVTVVGGNWHEQVSPATVALTWEHCVAAAGPEIPLGVHCSSPICSAPVVVVPQPVPSHPVFESVVHTTVVQHTPVHTPVHTTIVEHTPVHTPIVVQHPPVYSTVVGHVPIWTPEVHVPEPIHPSTIVKHVPVHPTPELPVIHLPPAHDTPVVIHTTVSSHETVDPHATSTTIVDPHATTTVVEHPIETVISTDEVSTETATTETADATTTEVTTTETTTTSTEIPVATPPADAGSEDVNAGDLSFPQAEQRTSESASASETATATGSTTTDAASASASVPGPDESAPFTTPSNDEIIPVARARRQLPATARRAWSSRRRV